jgi:hypothetical protein
MSSSDLHAGLPLEADYPPNTGHGLVCGLSPHPRHPAAINHRRGVGKQLVVMTDPVRLRKNGFGHGPFHGVRCHAVPCFWIHVSLLDVKNVNIFVDGRGNMVSTHAMVSTTSNTETERYIVATELDSELFARLNAFAAKNDRSRSWIIRQALLQFLGRKSRK